MTEDLEKTLARIEKYFQRNSIRAFATGSRIQGLAEQDSDLDIVILDDTDPESVADNIENIINTGWPVDVVQYSYKELVRRLERDDPFVTTMIRSMRPLTLPESVIQSLQDLAAQTSSNTDFITQVERLNIDRATVLLCQALIYRTYRQAVTCEYDLVPPRKLPEIVDEVGPLSPSKMERVLTVKKQAESGDPDTYALFREIIDIVVEADLRTGKQE